MVSVISHSLVALVQRAGLLAGRCALLLLHLHVRQLPHLREQLSWFSLVWFGLVTDALKRNLEVRCSGHELAIVQSDCYF